MHRGVQLMGCECSVETVDPVPDRYRGCYTILLRQKIVGIHTICCCLSWNLAGTLFPVSDSVHLLGMVHEQLTCSNQRQALE